MKADWQKMEFGKQVEYCADGDGFFVVRVQKGKNKLFHEAKFVAVLSDDIGEAIKEAEVYMASANPELFAWVISQYPAAGEVA